MLEERAQVALKPYLNEGALLMRTLERLLPRPVRNRVRRLRDLELRTRNLENVVDLIVSDRLDSVQIDEAFNGQEYRKHIFKELLQTIPFHALIETGTWLGNTTAYMSSFSKLPVFTCEIDQRIYACARRRLSKSSGISLISLYGCDSLEFIRLLSQTELVGKTLFFYLDAHWYSNLPLRNEIRAIAAVWSNFVVMIDDFRVPWDVGYGFDVYGGQALDTSMIEDLVRSLELAAFFPNLDSAKETGRARGCVVLASSGYIADSLTSIESLRASDQPPAKTRTSLAH